MKMKDKNTTTGHSEEHFTEDRNHWFNRDFLDLMAKRWQLSGYSSLLDVGAGLCHWSKLLVPYLKPKSHITALDNDVKWAKGSTDIERFFNRYSAYIDFVKGDAHELPFADNSFDVVTCQTLLIHVNNPELVLQEMKRVVKKDGIIICSEPNNRIQTLLQDTSNQDDKIEDVLNRVKQNLYFEKHKQQVHNGNQSFGDLLLGTMNMLGFKNIQSYLNDKLVAIYPPYTSMEQQAKINTYLKWGKTDEELEEFDAHYRMAVSNNTYTDFLKSYKPISKDNKVIQGLKDLTYSSGGASILYLISGKK
jgi:ubiquinone/menaquinone biosynthesis C-methylase UbiE